MPRLIQSRLKRSVSDTPVVLVHGPRQCGKTTLVQHLGCRLGYDDISFDDEPALAAAREGPVGCVHRLGERVVLDEIQRVPDLFLALKSAVDHERIPARFLLTGSTNILLLPKFAGSLAGWIAAGGYPEALGRRSVGRRRAWYLDSIEAVTQRDIRELSRIQGLDIISNLMALAAAQSGQLYDVAELAGPFRQSQPTIGEYMTLLENIFQITRVPSWHGNRLSRLVKMPKLHLVDTGIGCALLDLRSKDFNGLRKLQRALGASFTGGAVLYDGEETLPFGEGLWAVPLRRALEGDGEEAG